MAELSANHQGSLPLAIQTIRAAKKAGADAIKLQTYTPETITIRVEKEDFRVTGTIWNGRYLHDLYEEAQTPWAWHSELFRVAREEGLECFSSPFDRTAVDFLEDLNTPAYKIASFEITDVGLIEYAASKKKPIILSTGIADLTDIRLALNVIRKTGNDEIALLKCTSSYPAPMNEANLTMIQTMAEDFGVICGLSDHTLGIVAPVVAVSLGARIIEKHFILDRSLGGVDSSFSLNPEEFKLMVDSVRQAEDAIGVSDYEPSPKSKAGRVFSRSLYFYAGARKGELISEENVRSVRPGYGLHPKHFKDVLGKKLNRDVEPGDRVSWEVIEQE